ncbi:hypothetical protein [Polluticoccus soli]|uniref:hypothetical protein n=1 Tax=Polluticoccus soli TaxID=3034150 RepID=UPI0023E346AF|nr:hypothetical protein [Flavipsychrobacter sp. JY13-12]
MNRGYNEERYRPLDDDWQNQPRTTKTSRSDESEDDEKRLEHKDERTRHSPESDSNEQEKDSEAPE